MPFIPGVHTTATIGRLYLLRGQALCVVRVADAPSAVPAIPIGDAADPRHLYLGELEGAPCFGRALADDEPPPPGSEPVPLRHLHAALPDHDFAIAGRALGLAAWDANHRYCGRCGEPTVRAAHERARTCPRCQLAHYPRLSPAVIALVERDGQALLARNARFPAPFHSCLAGFVETGEGLEACVAREIKEEVGVEVADVRYFGSQPWPFTSSLMIGFNARWAGGDVVPDGEEIVEAGWFAPDALPRLPGKLSIARQLVDDFIRRHGGTPTDD
jgi:NAD+ diphosphatase